MRHQRSSGLLSSLSCAVVVAVTAGAGWLAAAQDPPATPRQARPQEAPPRDPNAPGAPVAIGKGAISGTVTVAGSGQPARRARVSLSGGQGVGGSRSTTTDDQGAFAFSALPEGRFNLSASKPGHVTGTYGQKQPGRPGTPIQLADGQRLQVQLQITRGGVITGTVLDEHGEALPGTPVRALRYVMQSGQRTLQSAGNGSTDDRGVYRIYGLQPGEYLVYATPRNNNQQGIEARQAELQQLVHNRNDGAAGRRRRRRRSASASRSCARRWRPPDATGDDTTSGYAPVYYPGTTTPANAATVTVAPGEEKGSIDFQYQVVPIARVEGIVTSQNSQIPPNIQVTLVNSAFAAPGHQPGRRAGRPAGCVQDFERAARPIHARGARDARRPRAGEFSWRSRTSGYRTRWTRRDASPGAAAAWPRQAADQVRLWATADVTVDGRNVSNVVLTLQQGMSVSGTHWCSTELRKRHPPISPACVCRSRRWWSRAPRARSRLLPRAASTLTAALPSPASSPGAIA